MMIIEFLQFLMVVNCSANVGDILSRSESIVMAHTFSANQCKPCNIRKRKIPADALILKSHYQAGYFYHRFSGPERYDTVTGSVKSNIIIIMNSIIGRHSYLSYRIVSVTYTYTYTGQCLGSKQ